jgi:hypothetical protein
MNSAEHIVGMRCQTRYIWRLYASKDHDGWLSNSEGLLVGGWLPLLYCPWCGVELNEWAKLQHASTPLAVVR